VSISPTFYEQFFARKCFAQLFSNYCLALQFYGDRIFIVGQAARKMLVKLTKEVIWRQGLISSINHGRYQILNISFSLIFLFLCIKLI